MSFDPLDCFEGGESDCCGARILLGGICSACKEHCEPFKDEDDDEAKPGIATEEITCPDCRGKGRITVEGGRAYSCPDCGGSGTVTRATRCAPHCYFPPKPPANPNPSP